MVVENLLCDELLQEIFLKLPPSSSSSVSFWSPSVGSTSTVHPRLLSLSVLPLAIPQFLLCPPFSLTTLPLLLPPDPTAATVTEAFSDQLLLLVSSCSKLSQPQANEVNMGYVLCSREDFDADLGLESLSLSGIRADDWGIGWLWRSCKKLKKPQLRSCDGIGDGGSFSSFLRCLQGIREVELRTCRSIVDGVLLKLAENCDSLNSLLVYDGGIREGLLRFFSQCSCKLQKFDLRLSLDLNNDHLLAVAVNFRMSGLLSQ
ncbi:hypothetical protein FEM48_Zijuj04G0022000 [Ziziphus jujuba var. spinosa]|uniref:Uncharacterized protein n=1 Tax=Ziziphus jujuba var. spinosa TaxID=714518 RepID=A0A978VH88_ZIZJJ|nr:hypothetical protein FEM48_Zijuj04G0022000 [Ziziphus jujuba var. spinosa]